MRKLYALLAGLFIASASMYVNAQSAVCHADFEKLPVTPTVDPLHVVFKALPFHSANKRPARICWQFGDGTDTCIEYSNTNPGPYTVAHRYNNPGIYEVCVKIRYTDGCEARKCKQIPIIRPDRCDADFVRLNEPVSTPLTAAFKALPIHNNNKKPMQVCWSFGDGRDTCINYGPNYTGDYTVVHRYLHPGQYEVCVRIIYYGGCDARKCKNISIPHPQNCSVRLFEITPSITSLVRGFLAVPHSDPPRRVRMVCWYFGDGTDTCITIDSNTTSPLSQLFIRHTYPAPGVYRACVKLVFVGGCIAVDCNEVVIRNTTNVCGGFMIDSLAGPRTYMFRGHAIHNPNDEVIGYRWSFGDGTTAVGRQVTHTYSQGGDYEVCLMIKTRLGCETKICKPVRVPGNNQPALHLSPNPVINVLNVQFFSTHTEPVNIKIVNNNGVIIRNYIRNVTVGPNNWNHELGLLQPGIYSYVVQSPNQLASAIFIKQ